MNDQFQTYPLNMPRHPNHNFSPQYPFPLQTQPVPQPQYTYPPQQFTQPQVQQPAPQMQPLEQAKEYSIDDAPVSESYPVALNSKTPVGSYVKGTIIAVKTYHARNYQTKQLVYTSTGKPRLQTAITLQITECSHDPNLVGQQANIYINNYGSSWDEFNKWVKTQPFYYAGMKNSEIFSQGANVFYRYNGKVQGQTNNGITFQRNTFDLQITPTGNAQQPTSVQSQPVQQQVQAPVQPQTQAQSQPYEDQIKEAVYSMRANGMSDDLIDQTLGLEQGTAAMI